MTRTGKFITPEELDALKTEVRCSGMWLSGGQPMGDPGAYVQRITKQYGFADHAIDPANGEFVAP